MALLDMRGICKYYPESSVLANDHVDFSLDENEIHAIVGENGAGKTTLMKILYGLERPDDGQILIDDSEVLIKSPIDAAKHGIGMVHQHFRLVPDFTVAENVTLGIEPKKYGLFLDRDLAIEQTRSVLEEFGFNLDPEKNISDLTVGQMQQVEIVKLLYRKARVLILDEPTSVLAEQQITKLFETLKTLTSTGKTIIIITHKLGEVKSISQRVTVMRQGKSVAVRLTDSVDEKELSKLMVGKSVIFKFEREETAPGPGVIELRDVSVLENGRQRPHLDKVNLKIHEGEIVGVAGVAGNGLGELEETVSGLRVVHGGNIVHRGQDITNQGSYILRERGLAYVPADRLRRGSSLRSSVLENMIISTHHTFLKRGIINQNAVKSFGRNLSKNFSISTELDVPIGTL
ncbi:MAG: ATP-binding cassette domain-containing protein, partial [Spirochaetales bacterium]|nr:ATP-binding cassette domain-containing protein [Spirochaetales bacterium]